jgi:hypothetical protein
VLFLDGGPPCTKRRYKNTTSYRRVHLWSRAEFHQRKAAHANHNSHTTMGSLFVCNKLRNKFHSRERARVSSTLLYRPEARSFKFTNRALSFVQLGGILRAFSTAALHSRLTKNCWRLNSTPSVLF